MGMNENFAALSLLLAYAAVAIGVILVFKRQRSPVWLKVLMVLLAVACVSSLCITSLLTPAVDFLVAPDGIGSIALVNILIGCFLIIMALLFIKGYSVSRLHPGFKIPLTIVVVLFLLMFAYMFLGGALTPVDHTCP
jgi:hypothetical protein